MKRNLRVSFNSPQSGWMSMSIKTGTQSFITAVSHAPYDSLRDLLKALVALLEGEESVTVNWNQEPEEYDFKLQQQDGVVQLNIVRYPDHRRLEQAGEIVFAHTAKLLDTCDPFWKALRELHRDITVDEFDKNWRQDFPENEMRELTKRIRAAKRGGKNEALR